MKWVLVNVLKITGELIAFVAAKKPLAGRTWTNARTYRIGQ